MHQPKFISYDNVRCHQDLEQESRKLHVELVLSFVIHLLHEDDQEFVQLFELEEKQVLKNDGTVPKLSELTGTGRQNDEISVE
jgi:hypothetical protein